MALARCLRGHRSATIIDKVFLREAARFRVDATRVSRITLRVPPTAHLQRKHGSQQAYKQTRIEAHHRGHRDGSKGMPHHNAPRAARNSKHGHKGNEIAPLHALNDGLGIKRPAQSKHQKERQQARGRDAYGKCAATPREARPYRRMPSTLPPPAPAQTHR